MKKIIWVLIMLLLPSLSLRAEEETGTKEGKRVYPKKIEVDKNHDGKIDHTEYYENGKISRVEEDTDYDGQVDEWIYYENGKMVKAERDTNKDGKADTWINY